ncbi:MAG: hypothetical protein A3J38_06780 [Gammaproteobacteria bacterium RIFCSPHIGHO2_12_FULL_45_9]|nr:MAG: hypothetical protein A3J38_06780 [Gammaproteobacteria bacterium RIFCSPHIGHO2_12_FULL_45_9]
MKKTSRLRRPTTNMLTARPPVTASTVSTGGIRILSLYGSHREMGIQYGRLLSTELNEVLAIIKAYYIVQHEITYDALVQQAQFFHNRYSYTYDFFLEGIAQGAALSLDDCKILNGMETLGSVIDNIGLRGSCAFLYAPPQKTVTGSALIGRNYDFPEPFDQCSQYLAVTVLHEPDKVPTAFIGMPGQIYCPSCINAEGMFMELNNGEPSGGYVLASERKSLLINMLEFMQNAGSYQELQHALDATESDYSLIINTATPNETKSFEYSSEMGLRSFYPNQSDYFVSTNFYQNDTWSNTPAPTDETTWMGVTRRNNLLSLLSDTEKHTIDSVKAVMDTTITNGGAVWDLTIYQMIFDASNLSLYLKSTLYQTDWTHIPLSELFQTSVPQITDTTQTLSTTTTAFLSATAASLVTGLGFFAYKKYQNSRQLKIPDGRVALIDQEARVMVN